MAHMPVKDYQPMEHEFPDEDVMTLHEEGESSKKCEWNMMFDGASNILGHGISAILISPEKQYIQITARLCFDFTNNIVEYEACTLGLEATLETKVKILKVFGDSALVILQLRGEWETRDEKLIPYHQYIVGLLENFEEVIFEHIPRENNHLVDALSTLASMFELN
jgi:ribonuclease HI